MARTLHPGPGLTIAYDANMRARLEMALDMAREMKEGAPVPPSIRDVERQLTEMHAEAVNALIAKAGLAPGQIALIGFHGQTILHRPRQGWTWQIGDGALLARLAGIDVVNDFRGADVKAGGEGAPLMPLYHAALARKAKLPMPFVLANIGGVAQVTYINGDTVLAYDTGPGNAPIDDWMHKHSGRPLDEGGAFARTGKIDDAVLARMLDNPFSAARRQNRSTGLISKVTRCRHCRPKMARPRSPPSPRHPWRAPPCISRNLPRFGL